MLISLINPASRERERLSLPPLELATIAALTPPGHQVKIFDENVKDLDLKEIPQLVGLTGMTSAARRAYQLAGAFKDLGSKVVMGGPHAMASPLEVKNYVDAVVLGEASRLWPRIVEDTEKKRLKPFYFHKGPWSLKGLPSPRRDLYYAKAYRVKNTLQSSRGCSGRCFFCPASLPVFRPILEVVEEIKRLRGKSLFFVDDNLTASLPRAQELFRRLIPLRRHWIGQASPGIAKKDLLQLARKSGCKGLFIGFHQYKPAHHEAIKRIHEAGIPIVGDFILGFDGEREDTLWEVVEMAKKEGLAGLRLSILTPFPGTPYYRSLYREGRIHIFDPSSYNGRRLVFATRFQGRGEIESLIQKAYQDFYSLSSTVRRYLQGPRGLSFFLSQNQNLAMSFKKKDGGKTEGWSR